MWRLSSTREWWNPFTFRVAKILCILNWTSSSVEYVLCSSKKKMGFATQEGFFISLLLSLSCDFNSNHWWWRAKKETILPATIKQTKSTSSFISIRILSSFASTEQAFGHTRLSTKGTDTMHSHYFRKHLPPGEQTDFTTMLMTILS